MQQLQLLLLAVCAALVLVHAAPQLSVTPDHIDTVEVVQLTVSWNDVVNPTKNDWIGLFSPPNDTQANSLLVYHVSPVANKGTTQVSALNMRQPYQFRYYQASPTNATDFKVVAESNIVTVVPGLPMHGHLALTNNPSEMRVMWVTGSTHLGVVEYGLAPGKYNWRTSGRNYTYSMNQMCGGRAFTYYRDPGTIVDVVLGQLRPATRYYYRFGSDADGFSSEAFFTTAPEVGPEVEVKFVAFGDLGVGECANMIGWCQPASIITCGSLASEIENSSFVLHIGDISYAVGYAERWEQFFHQIQPASRYLPWMVCPGNHEIDWAPPYNNYLNGSDSGGECGTPLRARFNMPDLEFVPGSMPKATDRWWYSFDYGSVHVTLMSTEHDFTIGSPQWNWIQQDLASIDRKKTPWVVFTGHRPMYVSTWSNGWGGDQQVGERMRKHLEDLLVKYHVDLAFWGHTHMFEHTCAVYEFTCYGNSTDPGAPIHNVIGMAGASFSTNWVIPRPYWSLYRSVEMYGYARIHAANSTALHFEFVGNTGKIQYDYWLTKPSRAARN